MYSKTEIKQESPVSEAVMENERTFFSRKMNTDGTVNDDCELRTKIKIKVENPVLDLNLHSEEDFLKKSINTTFMYKAEGQVHKAETKERERTNCSKDCVIKVENLDYEVDTKIHIKEEVWWPESLSANSLCATQDKTNEHSPPAGLTRSYMGPGSGDSSDESAILPDQDIHLKDDPELEDIKLKTHGTKTAAVVQDIQSEHIKCYNGGKIQNVLSSLKQDNFGHQNNEINNKLYACDVCGKNYTKLSSLKRHSLIHEGKMPYQCDFCGKNFRDFWNLSRHSFIHEGKKPYKCDVCEKEFAVMSSLKRHRLIHGGEKPHECNICKKAFIDFSHLKRHNRLIHENESVHKCDVCDKTFTYLSNLKTHQLIHEDKRPFKCSICEKSFAHLLGLKTHNHKIHGKRKVRHT